jgi:protein gp37
MSDNTSIQWTDASWNPWTGCRKVSSGCKFCYMMRDQERYGKDGTHIKRSKTTFEDPLKWKEPRRIFTSSFTDFFLEEGDAWRADAWEIIRKTPQHTYQILTKRPERILEHLPEDWGTGYPNVWMGTSVENQEAAAARIPLLLAVPARVRFISAEPLLRPIHAYDLIQRLDWVIIGGESGNDTGKWLYRPCDLNWIHSLVTDCQRANVPVFVKQFGTHLAKLLQLEDRHGGEIEEFPAELQIRQFPKQ